jgi:hypothetical protein
MKDQDEAMHKVIASSRLGYYGCPEPVHTLPKQTGHVIGAHAKSVVLGHPDAGVGFAPKLAVAPVTRTISVKANRPVVESILFGK